MRVKDKVAVVTGGASGIGAASARVLATVASGRRLHRRAGAPRFRGQQLEEPAQLSNRCAIGEADAIQR
jgi:NAD(P)-dependent dehydrogenase (short-subunit alcohol dehydrogenase family)